VEDLLTQMGIGEALVTMLNEKGIPTPLVHTYLMPPATRMDILTREEILELVNASSLVRKYAETVDNESAYEMLNARLAEATKINEEATRQKTEKNVKSPSETFMDNPMVRQAGRTAASIITRSLLGALGFNTSSRSRKKGFF
jgi:hypothetical protein